VDKDHVIAILTKNQQLLYDRFVRSMAIFGSVARDESTAASDVDLLVEFEPGHPKGLFEFLSLQAFLEDLLGCRIDLVMRDSLRPELRDRILQEAISAA
jgi:predicted nucleotidyltransferase